MAEEISLPVMYRPTRFRFPLWARRRSILSKGALERFEVRDVSVRRIRAEFEPRGLLRPYLAPEYPPSLDPAVYERLITEEAPVDGTEVVEWMHYAYADACALSARCLEYNRLGSELATDSGDGYIPGVSVEDLAYKKETGREVSRRGYAVAKTPVGNFNVEDLGKGYGIFRDLLSAGSISYSGSIQTSANLLKWKELAETPIRQSVGFFMDRRGNNIANFFEQLPSRPKLTVRVRQRFTSENSQTIGLTFRDPTDYSRVLGTRSVDIGKGSSEVTYTVSSFPYVPPTVAQVQPEDETETTMDEYVVV